MKRLSEVEKERDVLAHTLKGVQKAVFGLDSSSDKTAKGEPLDIDLRTVDFGPASLVRNNSATDTGSPTSPILTNGDHITSDSRHSSHETSRHLSVSGQSDSTAKVNDVPSKIQNDACNCCREPVSTDKPRGSIWRYANVTLMDNHRRLSPILPEEEALDEDIPIRVVLSSWDEVESQMEASRLELPLSWKIIRRIDEQLFNKAGTKERLASMYIMHLMLQFHRDPSNERRAKLPPWYLQRPSQTKPHAYATNFFVWPGVRERFVYEQHKYCNNLFAQLFQTCLTLLWPYDFRDCFMQNWETGTYELSSNFRSSINDISKWTMRPEFFRPFPDLRCDIPASWSNPVPTSNQLQIQLAGHGGQTRTMAQIQSALQHQQLQQVASEKHNDSHIPTSAPSSMAMSEAWLSNNTMVGWSDTNPFQPSFMDSTLQPQWAS